MTKEDARIIFGNIAEIAVFADSFSEQLEEALGSILEGGSGEDRVGELFLKMIPQMLPLYMTYIRRHPTALSHLQSLPQTAALTAYLAHTQTIASSLTHAWDLPSLLIKPVQRLLKYPLLLSTIVEETPDAHPDKAALRRAKEKCEEAAREVNEGRRRYEVVQEVLKGRPAAPGAADAKDGGKDGKRGKPGVSVPVGLAAAVALGKMKNLNLKSARPKEGAEEAERCERYEREIKDAAAFLRAFARHALAWVDAVRASLAGLRQWALGFARVIGLADDAESESEAFDAFLAVVGGRLVPLGATFDGVLRRELLVDAARLVDATRNPLRLLDALHTLEPLHYGLLNMTIGPKSRPPPALLEASQSYVALREQLLQELPDYTALLHRGIVSVVLKFAHWQAEFWGDVHIKWGELWDALRIEDEANNGADETIRVWWNRFAEVEGDVNMLNIVNPQKLHEDPRLTYHHLR
ncbi:Dbl domain-containing protein, partial [Punctularia strigosozonata HHB-11173 SS5]|uniref:Dbl domain-containing protein n=1 Tax=Punctularia strigosozonata (strain HHB-11173) TaxID=741275 RepID=UPI00044163D5